MAKNSAEDVGSWSFSGDDFASCHATLNTGFDWNATPTSVDAPFTWKMDVGRFSNPDGAAAHMTVGQLCTSSGYWQEGLGSDCDLIIILPTQGFVRLHHVHETVTVHVGHAAIYQPPSLKVFEAVAQENGFGVAFIQLSFVFPQKFLTETLHHPVEADLDLLPLIDTSGDKSRLILGVISMICNSDFYSVGVTISSRLRRRIIETFSQMLMELIPHRYTDRLQSQLAAPLPNHIRLAQKFMEQNIVAAPRIKDVARAAKVSVRTLETNFKTYMDMTPRTYMRVVRLRAARQALMSRNEMRQISEIALSLGFTHKGRFSKYYADLFGESPSATRRRGDNTFF